MKLIFATHNSHKLHEIRNALGHKYTVEGLSNLKEKVISQK